MSTTLFPPEVTEAVIKAMDAIGVFISPSTRFLVFAGASALALWAFRPKQFFASDGTPRHSLLMSKAPGGVVLDWLTFSVIFGAASVLLLPTGNL